MIAIARISPRGSPPGWAGSGFMISNDTVLTARHVVCLPSAEHQTVDTATLRFADGSEATATVVDDDLDLDIALLRITEPQSTSEMSVPIGTFRLRVETGQSVVAVGWSASRPFAADPDFVLAKVVSSRATIFSGKPAVKLQAPEAAAGKTLGGLSGGPVLVQRDIGLGRGAAYEAIAVVRWNQPRDDDTAVGGAFYATPMDAIVQRWPELRAMLSPVTAALPYSSEIRQFLQEVLGNDDEPKPFGGRQSDLQKMDRWLASSDLAPTLLVCAPSGRGKSTLMGRWWQRIIEPTGDWAVTAVFVPISIRHNLATLEQVLRALVSRLALVYGDDPQSAVATNAPEVLRERLGEYLALPAPGGRLVIVLDALDEASGWDIWPSLFSPASLGAGVRIAASGRQTEKRPDIAAWRRSLGWHDAESIELDLLTADGVGEALTSLRPTLDPALTIRAREVLDILSAGDPLVLGLYLQDMQNSTDRSSWIATVENDPVPPGLAGYLDRWWADQERLWGGPLGSRNVSVGLLYSTLSCSFGPISRRDLLKVTKRIGMRTGDDLDLALRDLHRWIIVDEADSTYSISHPRLAEYRRTTLQLDDELTLYDDAFIAWGEETIAKITSEGFDGTLPSSYIVRHYGEHLERSDASMDQLFTLATPAWRAAWEDVGGGYQGHLADVGRSLAAAKRKNRAAVKGGREPPHMLEQLGSVAALSDASSNATLMSPEFVGYLLSNRLWTGRRASEYIQAIPSQLEQAAAFRMLAPKFGKDDFQIAWAQYFALRASDEQEVIELALAGICLFLNQIGETDRLLRLLEEEFARCRDDLACKVRIELVAEIGDEYGDRLIAEIVEYIRKNGFAATRHLELFSSKCARGRVAAVIADDDPASYALQLVGGPALPLDSLGAFDFTERLRAVAPWISDEGWASIAPVAKRIVEMESADRELSDQISGIRRDKESAVDSMDFERAAHLRDKEKSLLLRRKAFEEALRIASPVAVRTILPHMPPTHRLMVALSMRTARRGPTFQPPGYTGRIIDIGDISYFDNLDEAEIHGLFNELVEARMDDAWLALGQLRPELSTRVVDEVVDVLRRGDASAELRNYLSVSAVSGDAARALLARLDNAEKVMLVSREADSVGRLLAAADIRDLLSAARSLSAENVVSVTRGLLASLASHGEAECREALNYVRADVSRTDSLVVRLLHAQSYELRSIIVSIESEVSRFAALIAARNILGMRDDECCSVIESFRTREWAVESLRSIFPRVSDDMIDEVARRCLAHTLSLAGASADDVDYVIAYAARVAELRDATAAIRITDRFYPSNRRDVRIAAGLCAGSKALRFPEFTLLEEFPGIYSSELSEWVARAAFIGSTSDRESQDHLFQNLQRHVVSECLVIDPVMGELVIGALPARLREEGIRMLPRGFLDGTMAQRHWRGG